MKQETIITTRNTAINLNQGNIDAFIRKNAQRAPEGCYWSVRHFKNTAHVTLVW